MEKTNTSGSRFLMLLKKYIVENNRRILLSVGALFAVLALCGFLGGVISAGRNVEFGQMLYLMFMSVLGVVGASTMFSEMKTKEGRTALLMEPANAMEKFLVRWLVWVVASTLLFWPAYEVAELMRRLGTALVGGEFTAMHIINFRELTGFSSGEWGGYMLAGYLCTQSCFVLGSILWPRLSFIKTMLALWILQTVGLIAFIVGLELAEDSLENLNMINMASAISDSLIYYSFLTLFIVTTLVNWTLSWMRLRESDNI